MSLVKLIAPTDPRWPSTLDAMGDEVVADSPFTHLSLISAAFNLGSQLG